MQRLKLIIGTHHHVALGETPQETEAAYQSGLRPLLSTFYAFPGIPVTLHLTGLLLEWLETEHPELLMLAAEMVARRQVEVIGGGYYDPILPMIPASDRLGQIEKLTTLLRVRFQTRPRGCWLAEQVWEPSLASQLRTGGVDYTFLTDGQLRLAGLAGTDLFATWLVEDQGKQIAVIPIATSLLDRLGAMTPGDFIDALRELADVQPPASAGSVVALIGEGTPSLPLVRNGWLEETLRLVRENDSWLEPVAPGTLLRDHPPRDRIYLPCCSSDRVAEWSLAPAQRATLRRERERARCDPDFASILHGGTFRQFFVRYPEAGSMYSKMMHTHLLVSQLRGDRYRKRAAQNELWRGQCNHAYWFGGAGGLYSNARRKATYRSLIEAEKIIRATEIFAPSIIPVDFDLDNGPEYLYEGSELNAYLHTRGGALFELDFLPASWNYLDTLARRDEGRGGADRYQRRAFLDHFLPADCTIEEFAAGGSREGAGFIDAIYDTVELNRTMPEVLLSARGPVETEAGEVAVRVDKRFVFRPRSIDVYYRIAAEGGRELAARFGVELNISLAQRSSAGGRLFLVSEDATTEIGSDPREIASATGILVRDVLNEVSVVVSSAKPFGCWSLPVETVVPAGSASQGTETAAGSAFQGTETAAGSAFQGTETAAGSAFQGTETAAGSGTARDFQCQCLVPLWDLDLAPSQVWENHLSIAFEKTADRRAERAG